MIKYISIRIEFKQSMLLFSLFQVYYYVVKNENIFPIGSKK
jgi:hypothetical protein